MKDRMNDKYTHEFSQATPKTTPIANPSMLSPGSKVIKTKNLLTSQESWRGGLTSAKKHDC